MILLQFNSLYYIYLMNICSNDNNGESLIKIKVGNQQYTIRGYSRAGLRTSILIDEMNIVFDMGYVNDRAFSYDNKLISHGHNDHIGSLHYDHSSRKLYNIAKEKLYIMPNQCIIPYKMIASAFSELNCGRNGENIKLLDNLLLTTIVKAEDCINNYQILLGGSKSISEYVVKAIKMDHKIASYGYIIYRHTKKLKADYLLLKKSELIKIKQEYGNDYLTQSTYTPLVAYTGDTTINGVLNSTELLNVPLLLMECTGFSDDDKYETLVGKHIHLDDIVEHHTKFNNKMIILYHFSQKYKKIEELIEYINKTPDELKQKLNLFF